MLARPASIAENDKDLVASMKHVNLGDELSTAVEDNWFQIAVVVPVFMPTMKHVNQVRRLLVSLLSQERLPALIVLVDDCSPLREHWEHILTQFQKYQKPKIVVEKLPQNRGPAAARNAGIDIIHKLAPEVQYICFTDSDCAPDSSWIASMSKAQAKLPALYSGTTLAADSRESRSGSRTTVGLYHDLFGTLNGRYVNADFPSWPKNSLIYGPTCNLSAPMAIFDVLKFDVAFPSASMEDVDFCLRASKRGIRVRHLHSAQVFHAYDTTVVGFCRQFFKYGFWERLVVAQHEEYPALLASSLEIPSI